MEDVEVVEVVEVVVDVVAVVVEVARDAWVFTHIVLLLYVYADV